MNFYKHNEIVMVKTDNFDISCIISDSSKDVSSDNIYSFAFDRSGELLVEGDI